MAEESVEKLALAPEQSEVRVQDAAPKQDGNAEKEEGNACDQKNLNPFDSALADLRQHGDSILHQVLHGHSKEGNIEKEEGNACDQKNLNPFDSALADLRKHGDSILHQLLHGHSKEESGEQLALTPEQSEVRVQDAAPKQESSEQFALAPEHSEARVQDAAPKQEVSGKTSDSLFSAMYNEILNLSGASPERDLEADRQLELEGWTVEGSEELLMARLGSMRRPSLLELLLRQEDDESIGSRGSMESTGSTLGSCLRSEGSPRGTKKSVSFKEDVEEVFFERS